jgi:hypothetical protein
MRQREGYREFNCLLLSRIYAKLTHLISAPDYETSLFTFLFFLSFKRGERSLIWLLLQGHKQEGLSIVLHLILLCEEVSGGVVDRIYKSC